MILAKDPCGFVLPNPSTEYSSSLDTISTAQAPTTASFDNHEFRLLHITLKVGFRVCCAGCGPLNKLPGLLKTFQEVSSVQIHHKSSQVEFYLKESSVLNEKNLVEVLGRRAPQCTFEKIAFGPGFELIVDGDASGYTTGYPNGVTGVVKIGKNSILVNYEPTVIGARTVLSHPFFRNPILAPRSPPLQISKEKSKLRKLVLVSVLSAVFTTPVLVLAYTGEHIYNEVRRGAIELALATVVQFGIGGFFYKTAYKDFRSTGKPGMDMLVVLSTTTAYICSVSAYISLALAHPFYLKPFFEVSTLLVTLIMAGKAISAFAHQKALDSISMESLQPSLANLTTGPEPSNEVLPIDVRLLEYNDVFVIRPNETIITDGCVISGESEIDESMVTGESALVHKTENSKVIAGSVNHSGILKVRVSRLVHENTIKTIGDMVDEAKSSKSKIQDTADLVARHFVPVIFTITLAVFTIWSIVGVLVHKKSPADACFIAASYAISTLVVSCPCAIGLAVPMVVAIAGGVGAKHSLILKTSQTMEIARKTTHVIFDKTGTLTEEKVSVVFEDYSKDKSEHIASIIHATSAVSVHPTSSAMVAHFNEGKVDCAPLEAATFIPGKGVEAKLDGEVVRVGNPYWLGVEASPAVLEALRRNLSICCISKNDQLLATFGLQGRLRKDALQTIKELQRRSISVSIISGDNEPAVQALALQAGIPSQNTHSLCNPSGKRDYISELQKDKSNVVLFCGDGTNDAIALAQANIGVHMSGGTEVAQDAADVVLMRPSLASIISLIDLSKAFHRRVLFNFIWCFVYNIFAVMLAAGAFLVFRIPPQYAGLGEAVSVLPVIFVAVSLRWAEF
ncbi:hypothetical protein HYALB_00006438 [Hymenoscyphus albidus]|uniref:Uncharacterized protein n=1 Tax=Hymenoscyphus albidus TaxID=595503 RepID=A0A9N9Q4R8_9HELO|nr:hypothetical protein HYALB_00006438 [Hymenoscyphus albidus]